ncbi:Tripeptidyl-peptidase SED1 [Grifola frondosa]|uniref:Tripeptidyl-peptidase SED1 n=1 Tax=Grifola frondosa TaxID=5627 RepID=A0A1C7M515_GRIFR|nr:Tripeptidyl-peptidase SED1 [Grifola frondosa]
MQSLRTGLTGVDSTSESTAPVTWSPRECASSTWPRSSHLSLPPSPRTNHVVHEKRAFEPLDWVKTRKLEADKVLPMRIGLTQQNLHKVEEMLMAVSHPKSPSYGQHWSPEDVIDAFAPSYETIAAVKEWLTDFGIAAERLRLSSSKGWIEVNATTAEVEELLATEYHVYTHDSGVEQIVQKRSFERLGMPGASSRSGPKTNGVKVTAADPSLANCDEMIVPDCLRALYSIDYTPVATDKNTFGIVEFTPQAFLAGDLDLFFGFVPCLLCIGHKLSTALSNFSPSQVGVRPTLVSIDGGVVQTTDQSFDFNGESDLDLEYAFALTNPQPISLLQTGDLVEGASFDNWLDAVDGTFCTFEGGDNPEFVESFFTQGDGIYPDPEGGGFEGPESCGIIAPPFVVSVSYGQDEASVTPAYAARQCAEYAKLGMMGTTVLYSSGDDGVAGNGGLCLNSRGEASNSGTTFNPDFPVTCPFVTAVGATQINPGSTVNDPEGACEQVIFSGGGFSNFFALPDYQATAVTSFLTNHPPPFTSKQFNDSGQVYHFPWLG